MGFFSDMFAKDSPKKIAKLEKRILDQHQQTQVRQESLDELVSIGTPEAIGTLVKRLGTNFRDSIKNEQEKRWVHQTLVQHFGPEAIEPLIGFIRSGQTISAAIRTLGELINQEMQVGLLVEVLESYDAKDHRAIEARMQIVDALTDIEDERIVPAVTPYALDHDDDVRIKVMDLLGERVAPGHDHYDAVVAVLVEVLKDPLASGRMTRKSADVLEGLGADLSKQATELTDYVPDGYRFADDGSLKKL